MADFLLGFATKDTIHSVIVVLLAVFARDVVLGVLRRFSARIRSDKDPRNDHLADAADAVADGLQKVKLPSRK